MECDHHHYHLRYLQLVQKQVLMSERHAILNTSGFFNTTSRRNAANVLSGLNITGPGGNLIPS